MRSPETSVLDSQEVTRPPIGGLVIQYVTRPRPRAAWQQRLKVLEAPPLERARRQAFQNFQKPSALRGLGPRGWYWIRTGDLYRVKVTL